MEQSAISLLLQLNEKIEDHFDNDIQHIIQDLDELFGYDWHFTYEQYQSYINLKKALYIFGQGNLNSLINIRQSITHFLVTLNYLKKER